MISTPHSTYLALEFLECFFALYMKHILYHPFHPLPSLRTQDSLQEATVGKSMSPVIQSECYEWPIEIHR